MKIDKSRGRTDSWFQFVTFRLGEEHYGVPVWKVKEIIRPLDRFPVPGMSDPVEGVINLRGEIIPVIKIHMVLHVRRSDGTKDRRKEHIIILDAEGGGFGFIVDEVIEVVRISPKDIQGSPDIGRGRRGDAGVSGIIQVSGRMIIVIDPKKIIEKCLNIEEITDNCATDGVTV